MEKNRLFHQFNEYQAEHALSTELPYWDFIDGVSVLSDGTLCMGFRLYGVAIETWDAERVNRFTHDLQSLLNGLNDGVEVTFSVEINSDYTELIGKHTDLKGDNPDIAWVSEGRIKALEEEMKVDGLLKTNLYLFVYQRLEAEQGKKASFFSSFFRSPKSFQSVRREQFEKMRRDLGQTAQAVQDSLQALGVESESLVENQVWDLIYRFLNPRRSKTEPAPKMQTAHRHQEFSPEELKIAPQLVESSPREQLVFSDLVQGYENFFCDGHYHRVLTLKTLPEATHAALISRLVQLPFHYWLDVHIQVPDQAKELSELQAKRRMAHSMSLSQGGRATDLESEAQLASTEELLRELINTGQKIFYFQTAMLLRSSSQETLEMMTKTALNAFRRLNGAEALAETIAGYKVFKTILPLGNVATVRPKRVKTDNLADFLPLYEPFSGRGVKPVCLFRNRNSGLVAYDPYDTKRLVNFNTLTTGASGSGKSFVNNLILLQFMTQKPVVFVIDIGGSYKKICEFMGGQYIEIAPPREGEERKVINPFQLEENEREPSSQKIKFLLALLESIFTDTDEDKLPKLSKSLLEEALIATYAQTLTAKGQMPQMSDLKNVLEQSSEQELKNFAKMLYPWTGDRAYGKMLDRPNELDLKSDFVVFDLKNLSNYPDLQSVMILILTDFIVGKVESPLYLGRRKRIVMDEVWQFLKSRAASSAMEYWVRTLRKSGSGVTFITQGLAEIVAHPISSAILSNTATKLILLQKGDLALVTQTLKLNEQETALISSLHQRKGLYSEAMLIAGDDKTVIRSYPTPVEYWLATSDADDNQKLLERRAAEPSKPLAQHIYELAIEYPKGIAAAASF